MSDDVPASISVSLPKAARVALIAARFNANIVDRLEEGCRRRLVELGADQHTIEVFNVPGAFELPLAAKWAARTGRFSAVICLGAVIRGDTPHFDYVAGECARGITTVNLETLVPVIFGVLTVNTLEQALARVGGSHGHAGERAADAAAEMIGIHKMLNVGLQHP